MGWVMMSERELNRIEVLAQLFHRRRTAASERLLRHECPEVCIGPTLTTSQTDPAKRSALSCHRSVEDRLDAGIQST